eukprot:PhM_4_TR18818/c2_g5_i1/m.35814
MKPKSTVIRRYYSEPSLSKTARVLIQGDPASFCSDKKSYQDYFGETISRRLVGKGMAVIYPNNGYFFGPMGDLTNLWNYIFPSEKGVDMGWACAMLVSLFREQQQQQQKRGSPQKNVSIDIYSKLSRNVNVPSGQQTQQQFPHETFEKEPVDCLPELNVRQTRRCRDVGRLHSNVSPLLHFSGGAKKWMDTIYCASDLVDFSDDPSWQPPARHNIELIHYNNSKQSKWTSFHELCPTFPLGLTTRSPPNCTAQRHRYEQLAAQRRRRAAWLKEQQENERAQSKKKRDANKKGKINFTTS